MRGRSSTITCALLGAALALAGCRTGVNTNASDKAGAPDKRAVVQSELAGTLQILAVHPESGADGILRIQIEIKSLSASTQNFFYKIQWLDEAGALIDLPAAPVPWSLRVKETSSLYAAAPTPLAKSFRITFASVP